jgi:hypothetical protein
VEIYWSADRAHVSTQSRKDLEMHLLSNLNLHSISLPRSGSSIRQNALNTETTQHPLFAAASQIVAISKTTIQEYNALCVLTKERSSGRPQDPANVWNEDKMKLLELLQNGKKVSLARIQKLIPEGQNEKTDSSSEAWYNETSLYFKEKKPRDIRLANTLQYTAKGVRKMAKALPEYID